MSCKTAHHFLLNIWFASVVLCICASYYPNTTFITSATSGIKQGSGGPLCVFTPVFFFFFFFSVRLFIKSTILFLASAALIIKAVGFEQRNQYLKAQSVLGLQRFIPSCVALYLIVDSTTRFVLE